MGKLTVEAAFAQWKKGEAPLNTLAKRVGRSLRGPFRKLAGGPEAFKKLLAARKAAAKKDAKPAPKKGSKTTKTAAATKAKAPKARARTRKPAAAPQPPSQPSSPPAAAPPPTPSDEFPDFGNDAPASADPDVAPSA